jgi:flagellar biosynthesis/type III secretory pathway protein FliH
MSSIEFLRKNLPSLFEHDDNNFYTKLFDEVDEMHKKEIKNGYNQGYREGLEDVGSCWLTDKDVSECSNADMYYEKYFEKNL